MAWWYVSPLESSSVRNIARYDHHYVPVTQDGLSCSPGYFDRLLDEEPIKKSNIFDNSSVQISPQVIPSEIICSLLSSNPIAKIDTEVAPNGRPKVKSFQGDPIFLVPQQSGGDTGPKQSSFLSAQSACNLGPRSRDPSRNVSRDQSKSPRRESEPTSRKVSISEANESRAIETIQAMNVHNNSGGVIPRGNSLPVQGSLPSPGPMQVVHGNVMTLLRGGRGSTIHHVEANTAIGSVGGVMGGSSGITGGMMMSFGPDRPDDARKDSNTTAKQSQTSDETSKAFHSSGGGGGKSGTSAGGGGTTTFDESRDADDEASSGKTSSSESDEFLRKIAIMANEAPLHHANLFRRPIEEFGLFVDTTLGHRLHIHKVEPGSNAFIEGLAPGDQILAINNKTVGQHDCDMDFDEALKSIRTNLSLHVIVAKCVNSYHKMPCKRIVVDLRNSSDGLGLSIGKNCENKLVIKGINTGGVAFKDGRVKRGDQILKISGVFTENLSTDDVGKLLKNSGKMVKLEVLQPNPHGEILVHINLKRHPKFGLGLGVAIYTSKLNETCTIIRNILPLSPADRNAKLSLDDELVAINGRSTCTMNSNEILDLLKNKAISHYSIQIRQKERNKEYLTTKRPKKSEEKEPCCISGPFFKPH